MTCVVHAGSLSTGQAASPDTAACRGRKLRTCSQVVIQSANLAIFFVLLCKQLLFLCAQTHLGKTHLVMEPVAVATRLCLPDEHPLSPLLRAHTRFLIFVNDLARKVLVGKDGTVDKLFAGAHAASSLTCCVMSTAELQPTCVPAS